MSSKTLRSVISRWLDGTAARHLPQSAIAALIDVLDADGPETADTSAILDSCGYSAAA